MRQRQSTVPINWTTTLKCGAGKLDDNAKVGVGKLDDNAKVGVGKLDDHAKVGVGKLDAVFTGRLVGTRHAAAEERVPALGVNRWERAPEDGCPKSHVVTCRSQMTNRKSQTSRMGEAGVTINMTSDVCAQRHSDAGGDAGQPVGKVSVSTLPIECGGAARFCPPARLTRNITRRWKASSHAADAVVRQLATLSITSCDRPQRRRLGYALTCMLLLSATQAVAEGTLTAQLTAFMQRQFTPAPLSLRVQV